MKHGISFVLALLVPWLGFAQFSPPPVIDHFGGMSLDSSVSIGDSTFCRALRGEVYGSNIIQFFRGELNIIRHN